jgi:CRP-like cAMP-binding protein
MAKVRSWIEFLKKVSIFSDLDDEDLRGIEQRLVEKEFSRNGMIVRRNDPGDSLYIILYGEARAILIGESGREIVLSYFRAGDFFGEMSLIDDKLRSAYVLANEDTKVLVLYRDGFRELIHQRPQIAFRVMSELCDRIRRSDEIIGNLALLDVYGRVARFLIEMVRRDSRCVDDWYILPSPPTQQEIANITGTTRETVSRIFRDYKLRGVLRTGKGQLSLRRNLVREFDEAGKK